MLPKAVKPVLFLLCLVPLALLVGDALTGGLLADPVEDIRRRTGAWTLRFLLITLAVTPLRQLTGYTPLIRLRRMFGLFGFFYVSLHVVTYIWLDADFSLNYIFEDVVDRVYITAGFVSFLMMLPLAATSTNAMIRRLSPGRWRSLHRLVYAVAIGGCLHFLWLVKADLREPLIYSAILGVLLVCRLPAIAARLSAWRVKPAQTRVPSPT